ncbi:MAG: VCBS repeat-containing protein [Sulfitobacter sp.]|jgi:VCBS repeat-containing protein
MGRDLEFTDGAALLTGSTLLSPGIDALTLPENIALFEAQFDRLGQDLVLSQDGAPVLTVPGYFLSGAPVDLVAANGAVLPGELAARLAGSSLGAQYAQLGGGEGPSPIGQVETASGLSTVQHIDGSQEELAVGVKIYQNDIISTTSQGKVSVTFSDGTIFSLAQSSRMVIDTLIYDPDGGENAGSFSLLSGGFVFIAGQVAKTGDMDVNTPTATMGIRGTTVQVDIEVVGGVATLNVALNRDPDGGVGSIELTDLDGNLIAMITATDTQWVVSPIEGETREVERTETDFAADSVLLADAFAAFQSAVRRVEAGETFVELGDGSGTDSQGNVPAENNDPLPPPNVDGEGEGAGTPETSPPVPAPGGSTAPTGPTPPANNGKSEDETNLNIDNTRGGPRPSAENLQIAGVEDTPGDSPISGIVTATSATESPLAFALGSAPSNGTAQMAADGRFTYVPDPDFFGSDSFTYVVTDAEGKTDTGQVTVAIADVNDAPGFENTVIQAANGGAPVALALSSLVTDPDAGDTQSFSLGAYNGPGAFTLDGNVLTFDPGQAFVALGADESATVSINATVHDKAGAAATSTITVIVAGENDAPSMTDGTVQAAENAAPVVLDLLALASDADTADTQSFSLGPYSGPGSFTLVGADLIFDPGQDFQSLGAGETTVVALDVTVTDRGGATATATVSVTVAGENDAPVLGAAEASRVLTVNEDSAVAGTIEANDLEGDPITFSLLDGPVNGAAVVRANGTFSYVPEGNFEGTDGFTYLASDGKGGETSGSISITVTALNDAPELDLEASVLQGSIPFQPPTTPGTSAATFHTGPVLLGVTNPQNPVALGTIVLTDPDQGESFDASFAEGGGAAYLGFFTLGAVTVSDVAGVYDLAWAFEMDLAAYQALPLDDAYLQTYDVTIADAAGQSVAVTVTVDITGLNDAPVFAQGALQAVEDGAEVALLLPPLVSDPDTVDSQSFSLGSYAGQGVFSLFGDVLTFDPAADFQSLNAGETTDVLIDVTVADAAGDSATTAVRVTITGENDAPTFADGTIQTPDGALGLLDLTSLVTDADAGDTHSFALGAYGGQGTFALQGNILSFDPENGFSGLVAGETATLSTDVSVTDAAGAQATSVISVTVTGGNDAPVFDNGSLQASEDGAAVSLNLSGLVADPDAVDTQQFTLAPFSGPGSFGLDFNIITFDPGAGFQSLQQGETTAVSAQVTVQDTAGAATTAMVTATVTGENDAPIMANGAIAAEESGSSVALDLTTLVTDVDAGDSASFSLGQTSGGGSFALVGDMLVFNPGSDFNDLGEGETASVSAVVMVQDGAGAVASSTVTVTVTGVNAPPAFADGVMAAAEDGAAVTLNLSTLVSDPDQGDSQSFSLGSTDAEGTFSLAGAELTFDPGSGFQYLGAGETTDVTAQVSVQDAAGASDSATITVTITGENDAPAFENGTLEATEGGDAVTLDLSALVTDSDAGDSTAFILGPTQGSGTFSLAGNVLAFDPGADFQALAAGETTSVSAQISVQDSAGEIAVSLVTVTVTGVNQAPEFDDGTLEATEDGGPVSLSLSDLVSDADAGDTQQFSLGTAEGGGTFSLAGNLLSFDPGADFQALAAGETTSASTEMTVTDSAGETAAATLTVTVTGVNDAPTFENGTLEATEGGDAVTLDLSALVTDADAGDTQVFGLGFYDGEGAFGLVGTVLSFFPDAGFQSLGAGETTLVSTDITVTDSAGESATASVNVTVTGVNDAPTFAQGTLAAEEDGDAVSLSLNDLAADADAGDSLVFNLGLYDGPGAFTLVGDVLSFDPGADFQELAAGETTSVSALLSVTDSAGATAASSVTVTLTGQNDAPIAVDDSVSVAEDGVALFNVRLNDSDIDGDSLIVLVPLEQGAHGSVQRLGQNLRYIPDENFNGQDSFTYTIIDGAGGSATATVTVTVTPVNDAPVIGNLMPSLIVSEDGILSANANLSASDLDGDMLNYTIVGGGTGTYGTASINGQGEWSYALNNESAAVQDLDAGDAPTDSFTLQVSDGNGGIVQTTGTVTVQGADEAAAAPLAPVSDVVIAVGYSYYGDVTLEPFSIDVLANDVGTGALSVEEYGYYYFGEGYSYFKSGYTYNYYGTLTLNEGSQTLTFTPYDGFLGVNGFQYTVSDDIETSALIDVTLVAVDGSARSIGVIEGYPYYSSADGYLLGDSGTYFDLDFELSFDGGVFATNGVAGAYGTASIDQYGMWTYTLDDAAAALALSEYGFVTDDFDLRISDGLGGFATTTLTAVILDNYPEANDDFVSTTGYYQDGTIDFTEYGAGTIEIDVLGNDATLGWASVTRFTDGYSAYGYSSGYTLPVVDYYGYSSVYSGNVSLSEDAQRLIFTPYEDFFGLTIFEYDFTDHAGNTDTATVEVAVKYAAAQITTGTAGYDEIMGSDQADTLGDGGGSDVILAFGGDDLISVSGADAARLDGGTGRDVLSLLTPTDYGFSGLSGLFNISNIEALNLENAGDDTLILTEIDLFQMSDNNDVDLDGLLSAYDPGGEFGRSFSIYGDSGDSIEIFGDLGHSVTNLGATVTETASARVLQLWQISDGVNILATLGIDTDVAVSVPGTE